MPTSQENDAPDRTTLSATEREWLERQGRAARALEVRQRNSAAKRARSTFRRRDRDRPQSASLPRSRSR